MFAHNNTSLTQETRETNKKKTLTLYLKQLEKEEMKNPKVSRRKEIIKVRAEIIEKERWLQQKPAKLKVGLLRR